MTVQRSIRLLFWVPLAFVAGGLAAAGAGADSTANLFGLMAGLTWLGGGAMLWAVVPRQGPVFVCLLGRRVPARAYAAFVAVIGVTAIVTNGVRLS